MNQDKIHDALNLLDDSMIEAVEKLRNKRKKKHFPMHWISAAACLCIAVVILFAAGKFSHLPFDTQKEGAAKPENYNNITNAESGITEESKEIHSILVEITSWKGNGFTGTVAGILDTDIYAVGTELSVLFSDDISYFPKAGCISQEGAPTSTDFPIGCTVWVQFYEASENAPETEAAEPVLYAENIGPANMAG